MFTGTFIRLKKISEYPKEGLENIKLYLSHNLYMILYFLYLQLLEYFIDEYFDQNPISQLGIIVTKNKRAEKVTELGGKMQALSPMSL